jgi:hypothetical protein
MTKGCFMKRLVLIMAIAMVMLYSSKAYAQSAPCDHEFYRCEVLGSDQVGEDYYGNPLFDVGFHYVECFGYGSWQVFDQWLGTGDIPPYGLSQGDVDSLIAACQSYPDN